MAKTKKTSPLVLVAIVIAAIAWFLFDDAGGSRAHRVSVKGTEDSYVLKFGADFKPQQASRDDLGISVVLAIDCSGSMSDAPKTGGVAKYVQASTALERVVEVLGHLVKEAPKGQVLKVGILKFNDTVSEVMPLAIMDAAGIAKLDALVRDPSNFAPGGSTAIGMAVEQGVERLSQSGTILRSLIVVTDGQNMEGVAPAWALSAVYNNRNSASTPDFPVLTGSTLVSFIGFDIDSGVFQPLSRYGARIMSATNQSQLAEALSGLLEADVTKLEAPALGAVK
jgi:hypothetical protein